jgi:hypothetical protein
MRRVAIWSLMMVLGVLGGCTCEPATDAPDSKVPASCQTNVPLVQPVRTDILFVIDDSDSMSEEQAGVAAELPAFIAELTKGGGVVQDFQVGVITTSVYAAAVRSGTLYYTAYPEGGWLQLMPLVDGGPGEVRFLPSTDPELVPRFSLLVASVGINGSGQETPFEATRIAVTGQDFNTVLPDGGNPNVGFLRDGARLLVVVVSDEDDCSEEVRPPLVRYNSVDGQNYCVVHQDLLTPVGDYYTLFQSLPDGLGRLREVVWAAIAPVSRADKVAQGVPGTLADGTPIIQNIDCPTSAAPGYRHRAMAYTFDPSLENLSSICDASYHQALVDVARRAAASQTLELDQNVPDPALLQITIVRADGSTDVCTVANNGIRYEAGVDGGLPRVHFRSDAQVDCLRRASDTQVTVRLFCAG